MAIPAVWMNLNPAKGIAGTGEVPEPDLESLENDDWKKIRKEFELDKKQLFLNNGTMGPSPRVVTEAVVNSLREVDRTASYGGWETAIHEIARFFGALEEEICLTHNVTDGINIIAQGLPLKEGDELIISNQEHVGNALPWLARAQRDKLVVRVLDLTLPNDELLPALNKLIGERTRVIALPHIPCTNGRILPVEEIGVIAKENKLFYFLDGAHGPGMLDLDLGRMNCDFYATCTHKWMLGPKGTGFLFIRKDKLQSITPIFTGAYSDTGWNLIHGDPRIFGWAQVASRHLNGTQNRSLFDGVIAAIAFHEKIGKQKIAARIRELNDYLYSHIATITGIKIITPITERAGLCSFTFDSRDYLDFQRYCTDRNIVIRAVPENEVNAIRISTHIYNTTEEIDTFVRTLTEYLHA